MTLDMEAMMADAEARKCIENVQNEMEKNAEASKLMDAAASLADLYEVAKKYVFMKFEAFKSICKDAFAYFSKEEKVALSDETLEAVAGGGWFSDIWNKCKKVVVAVAVGVGVGALCAAGGAILVAGLGAAVVAGTAGTMGVLGGVSAGILNYLKD